MRINWKNLHAHYKAFELGSALEKLGKTTHTWMHTYPHRHIHMPTRGRTHTHTCMHTRMHIRIVLTHTMGHSLIGAIEFEYHCEIPPPPPSLTSARGWIVGSHLWENFE